MRLFWRNLFRYNGTRGELGQIGLKAEKKWNELWVAAGLEDPPLLTDVSPCFVNLLTSMPSTYRLKDRVCSHCSSRARHL